MLSITFLGTTAGKPSRARGCSSVALQYGTDVILFDCGENAQRQLLLAKVSPMKIKHILLTHWHADHWAGLVPLLQTLSLQGRTTDLYVTGPKGTKKHMKALLSVGEGHMKYDVVVSELSTSDKFAVSEQLYDVLATPSIHSVPSMSYRFQEKDKPGRVDIKTAKSLGVEKEQFSDLQRGKPVKTAHGKVKPQDVLGPARLGKSVVYTGDTGYNKSLVPFSKNADVLIHESTYADDRRDHANELKHSTSVQAAEIAKKAGVRKLALTHFSSRYKDVKPLVQEAEKIFKNTIAAEDLMQFEV